MAGHLLTLPKPRLDPELGSQIRGESPAARPESWFVLHVLAQNCKCSQGILAHLLERGRDPSFTERVLFIGKDDQARTRLLASGFEFEDTTPEVLEARYGIQGAPVMVVVSPQGKVVYSGGYSRTSQGVPEDSDLLRGLLLGEPTKELPLFGCAVSRQLQKRLDPLGLKYSRSEEARP